MPSTARARGARKRATVTPINARLIRAIAERSGHLTLTLQRFRRERLTVIKLTSGAYGSRAGVVIPGLYSHLRRGEATWNFLLLAGVPQTAAQVFEAIARGKCLSRAADPMAATQSCLSWMCERGKLVRTIGTSVTAGGGRRTVRMYTLATG